VSATGLAAVVQRWRSSLSIPGKPNEWESKGLLRSVGIAVPRGAFIEAGNSVAADSDISVLGTPGRCAVKVCSGEILHKTEQEGVLLDVAENHLPAAVATLQQRFPSAGVLVEEMVPYRVGEIIIGALYDPTFGPAVMVGAGGILTELYKDVVFRLAPCTAKEAHLMLEELTIYPTLRGYRGLSGDANSLAAIIAKVAELALQLIREDCQLDINPIVWSRDRWVALDVKAILEEGGLDRERN
jgi:succinyl-CoA synthetase beta subunit